MKYQFIAPLFLAFFLALAGNANAHIAIPGTLEHAYANDDCTPRPIDVPVFHIRICVNLFVVTACVELDCDLSWTDVIVPGSGQLLGHDGCRPIGSIANPNTGATYSFTNNEEFVGAIESVMDKPAGTLKFLEVLQSPTFPGPDGKGYRVVAKTYQILKDESGRYLPLEVEVAR